MLSALARAAKVEISCFLKALLSVRAGVRTQATTCTVGRAAVSCACLSRAVVLVCVRASCGVSDSGGFFFVAYDKKQHQSAEHSNNMGRQQGCQDDGVHTNLRIVERFATRSLWIDPPVVRRPTVVPAIRCELSRRVVRRDVRADESIYLRLFVVHS